MKHHDFLFLRLLLLLMAATMYSQQITAQYYYHDILLTIQNQQEQQLYKKSKITRVKLLSYESNGSPSESFICEIVPQDNYTRLTTFSQTDFSDASLLTAFFSPEEKLLRTIDSTREMLNTYEYRYDADGRLLSAVNEATDKTGNNKQTEVHEWVYAPNGCPLNMHRIRNTTDTTEVKFLCDSLGNVIEEVSSQHHIQKESFYYYYDDRSRLTDVVRYHSRLEKLLPDYMFEYNDQDQIIQMTEVLQGGADYLLWKYEYGEDGLKTTASCFDKQKRLVGRIVYQYSRSK